ncbi:hypothetical protein SKAU_G00261540 [Synaphobranchus kaupii]|uniref:Uncharacterized protein n=1 Tax=Synaphobranchus kaupii TaxID=118154 RepID=A0A9Q1INQ7_SYNKA|nr:hypothetical protein SKAU_G00261540 [Synaphobranchus kaupii]
MIHQNVILGSREEHSSNSGVFRRGEYRSWLEGLHIVPFNDGRTAFCHCRNKMPPLLPPRTLRFELVSRHRARLEAVSGSLHANDVRLAGCNCRRSQP